MAKTHRFPPPGDMPPQKKKGTGQGKAMRARNATVIHIKEDRYELIIKDNGEIPEMMLPTIQKAGEVIVSTGLLHHLIMACARCANYSQFAHVHGVPDQGQERWDQLRAQIHQVAEDPFTETHVEKSIREQMKRDEAAEEDDGSVPCPRCGEPCSPEAAEVAGMCPDCATPIGGDDGKTE